MNATHWTGDDDREALDARRDAPIREHRVPCASCDEPVRVLTAEARKVRVYCAECWTLGAPIRRT